MFRRPLLLLLLLVVPALASCGSDKTQSCDAGVTQSCPCPDGTSGTQTCSSSGTFPSCTCGTPQIDAPLSGPADASNGDDCSPETPFGRCATGSMCLDGACCPTADVCNGNCCMAGQTCLNNICSSPQGVCSPSNPGGTCASGSQCVNGSCCADARACDSTCCAAGAICFMDGAGNKSCATICDTNAGCPAIAPCCGILAPGVSACISSAFSNSCKCGTGDECSTGVCAPLTDGQMNPVGPYVCKPDDCAAYDGCSSFLSSCDGSACYVQDIRGNKFCANPCTNDSMCGAAMCETYNFSSSTCSGPKACGP